MTFHILHLVAKIMALDILYRIKMIHLIKITLHLIEMVLLDWLFIILIGQLWEMIVEKFTFQKLMKICMSDFL